MGWLDRLLLLLYSLGIAALAVFGFLFSFQLLVGPEEIQSGLTQFNDDPSLRWAIAGVSLFVFIISLRFIFKAVIKQKEIDSGVDRETEIGHIRISLRSIESIAAKAARRVKGVRDLTARVRHRTNDSSVGIGLKIVVDGETPIQHLSEQLQLVVKEQVEQIAGVQVDQVSVYVAQTIQPDKSRVRVD
ncbi:alkaline shock response membrane anchor protein AmaP [Hazenella coriacea]|uniref:Putative alkaline shock family protein YloU n=1 Tax=Hazenella coriacea TaxID=1179467 RepID=A0A4R3LDL0_9BACL|nr:alkaline shock response membrane anchor protein AmaP [Hazenella coriacea]TCS96384.1 putative alkaline shock family protein YloU [Hazenella coriacea]